MTCEALPDVNKKTDIKMFAICILHFIKHMSLIQNTYKQFLHTHYGVMRIWSRVSERMKLRRLMETFIPKQREIGYVVITY